MHMIDMHDNESVGNFEALENSTLLWSYAQARVYGAQ